MEDLGWCALQFLIEARKYLKIRDWDKYQIPEGTTYRVHILPRHWNVLRGWTQGIGYPLSALVEIHPVHWWISTANWALNWSTPTTLQSYALVFFFTVIFPVFFMSWLSYILARSSLCWTRIIPWHDNIHLLPSFSSSVSSWQEEEGYFPTK